MLLLEFMISNKKGVGDLWDFDNVRSIWYILFLMFCVCC